MAEFISASVGDKPRPYNAYLKMTGEGKENIISGKNLYINSSLVRKRDFIT